MIDFAKAYTMVDYVDGLPDDGTFDYYSPFNCLVGKYRDHVGAHSNFNTFLSTMGFGPEQAFTMFTKLASRIIGKDDDEAEIREVPAYLRIAKNKDRICAEARKYLAELEAEAVCAACAERIEVAEVECNYA